MGQIVEWLLGKGAVVRKGGEEYCVNCPRCGDVKKHLYVNPRKGVAHCFRCGWGGRLEEVLVEGFRLSWKEVSELLRGFEKEVEKEKVWEQKSVDFPVDSLPLEMLGEKLKWRVMSWCNEERVKYEDLVAFGCRFWEYRLVIPCWKDKDRKELWYWVARNLVSTGPKYINFAGEKGSAVWGIDWYECSDGVLWVCEGWKDAYRVRGIALLGKEMSIGQEEVICSLAKKEKAKIRVVLDQDAWKEGVVIGRRLWRRLGGGVEVGFLKTLKDPGEGKDKWDVDKDLIIEEAGNAVKKFVELSFLEKAEVLRRFCWKDQLSY